MPDKTKAATGDDHIGLLILLILIGVLVIGDLREWICLR